MDDAYSDLGIVPSDIYVETKHKYQFYKSRVEFLQEKIKALERRNLELEEENIICTNIVYSKYREFLLHIDNYIKNNKYADDISCCFKIRFRLPKHFSLNFEALQMFLVNYDYILYSFIITNDHILLFMINFRNCIAEYGIDFIMPIEVPEFPPMYVHRFITSGATLHLINRYLNQLGRKATKIFTDNHSGKIFLILEIEEI